jgi:uncharacterized protein YqcC (DUF446 family)
MFVAEHIIEVKSLLMDIEHELRILGLWEKEIPPEEALSSLEPFAVDSLTFSQWLQFIFLPKMYFLIEQNRQLPTNCQITPMAEEYFSQSKISVNTLLQYLRKVDDLLSETAIS